MASACCRAHVTSISPALLATLDGHVAANGKFFSKSDALSYRADAAAARWSLGFELPASAVFTRKPSSTTALLNIRIDKVYASHFVIPNARRLVPGQRRGEVVKLGELGPPPFVLSLPLNVLGVHHVSPAAVAPADRWR